MKTNAQKRVMRRLPLGKTRAALISFTHGLLWDEYERLMHTEDISGWYEIWERDC